MPDPAAPVFGQSFSQSRLANPSIRKRLGSGIGVG